MGLVVAHSSNNFNFNVNELMVHRTLPDKIYTVCWVFPKQNQIALILQRTRPQKPIIVTVGGDIDGDAWEEYERKPNDFIGSPLFSSETAAKRAVALAKFDKIKPIIDSGDIELYVKGDLGGLHLRTYVKKARITIQTLYKYLNQYLAFGSHPLALLPLTFICGTLRKLPINAAVAEQKRSARGGTHIGAKGSSDDYLRRQFNLEDRERLLKFISKILPTAPDHKLASLYALFGATLCQSTTEVFGVKESFTDPLKLISDNQFNYNFLKEVNHVVWAGYQKSIKHVQNNDAISRGKAQDYSLGPSHTYEIDATRLNLYVVSRIPTLDGKHKKTVLGRPYLYFVVDSFCSKIVGYTVTFQAGTSAVKKALFNAFTNKVDFCEKYGVQIDEDDWPSQHICTRLLCDRAAEYTEKLFDDMLAADLLIETITYATAYISRRKGSIEVNFNAGDLILFQQLPGAVKSDPAKDAAHSSNFAEVDILTLNQLIIEAILSFNKRRINFTRLQTFDVFEGVKPTPLNLWKRHISRRMGGGNKKSNQLVMYALLDQEIATVKKDGVHLSSNKLVYRTDHKEFQKWQQECLLRGMKAPEIKVRINDDDPRYMWFRSPQFGNDIIEFTLASHCERFEELIQLEIDEVHAMELRNASINRKDRTSDRIELQRSILEANNEARQGGKSKVDRKSIVSGINDNFKAAQNQEIAGDIIQTRQIFGTLAEDFSHSPEPSSDMGVVDDE
ncbi:MAG: transposase family protein [Paraglaciecola sp.]|uniref:integrase catalytic domain-containing protein n=1 Tax=Paraglaciecola sp. TaxID=1920173 RepID=UPI00273E5322|nr:transposase family protein [Paraglaciecola sp.]MDP5031655.1 transposase family protein [Paraglaciecola sp.]MDP5134091.1 transposase family protein [Paraglaciecola sp.]